jgi:peptidoglycan hydrolase-like protein with peptidoglycan-binding domain
MARYLYQGCEPGFDVMELQDGLNNARLATGEGSALDTLAVDGIFGARTGARVLEFQRTHQLGADAVVGPRTWSALEAVLVTIPGLQVRRPMGGGGNPGTAQGPQGPAYGKPVAEKPVYGDAKGLGNGGGGSGGSAKGCAPGPAGPIPFGSGFGSGQGFAKQAGGGGKQIA